MLSRRQQQGLSLVELMVGIAVGLFVVAAAALVVTTQLGENRRLLLETQVQQDLRATMDIITREMRRAGSWESAELGVWYAGGPVVQQSTFNTMTPVAVAAAETQFRYRRGPGQEGPFGFKLEGGVVKSLIGNAWQDLTDGNVMRVTNFVITPVQADTSQLQCPRACSVDPNDTACWPTVTVRSYTVNITAQATHDAAVQRSVRSRVRLRNDAVRFNDAANPNRVCPP